MNQFVDLKTIAKIKDLPLVAKTIAEGFLLGLQSSTQRGVGIEFSQYRAYQEGDELARIDWKLFARSDRYFVREAERESEINIWFLLDSSASMLQRSEPTENKGSLTKLDYAKYLIASLSYLANRQGDSFGFLSLNDRSLNQPSSDSVFIPPNNGDRHWQQLLIDLYRLESGHYFPKIDRLTRYIEKLNTPSVIFVISDFYQQHNEIEQLCCKLNTSRCEVVALPLYCQDELEFDYSGAIRFQDLETQESILVSAQSARKTYLNAYQQYWQDLISLLTKNNISYHQLNIDHPLDNALYHYMKLRNKVAQ